MFTVNPDVSIVIPLYNAERWIEETLTSVFEQIYDVSRIEIIIVDDGSTDGGTAQVREMLTRAPCQSTLISTTNGGPSRSRNLGWRCARGTWIQFLDDDDFLAPEKLVIQMAFAHQAPEEIAVVYSDWQRLSYIDGKLSNDGPPARPRIGADPVADLLRSENFIATGSQIFRRSWLEQVGGFDERHRLIEDVELMLRIAMAGGIFQRIVTSAPLFFYRQRSDSLSQHNQRAFIEGCVRNACYVENYWRQCDALSFERAKLLADIYCQATRFYVVADRLAFEELINRIEALVPRYLPPGPPLLRAMSYMVSYRHAEPLAVLYRQIKRFMGKQFGMLR